MARALSPSAELGQVTQTQSSLGLLVPALVLPSASSGAVNW